MKTNETTPAILEAFPMMDRTTPVGKYDLSSLPADFRAARLDASARGPKNFLAWVKTNKMPKSARIVKEPRTARVRAWEASRTVKSLPNVEPQVKAPEAIPEHLKPLAAALKTDPVPQKKRDPRLPKAGTILRREYKGKKIAVKVLADSFVWKGKTYDTISALTHAITGYTVNGIIFFGLRGPKEAN